MNTIPLARISSDDGRPAGLKLDRVGYGHPRDNPSIQKSFDKDSFHKPLMTHYKSSLLADNDAMPRSSMESDHHRPGNMPTAREFMSSRGAKSAAQRSSNQPSVPARSPFRARDSQASVNAKSGYDRYQVASKPPLTNGIDERGTERTQHGQRGSLSAEIAHLWKYSPSSAVTDEAHSHETSNNAMEESNMDALLMQLLVSQAVFESREFKVLPFEELDVLRNQYLELREQVANLMNRWSVEIQIHQTSRALAQLEGEKRLSLEQEAIAATQKAGTLSMELVRLMEKENKTRNSLLEHTAGALRAGVERLEKIQPGSTTDKQASRVAMLEEQLAEAKAKISSQEKEIQAATLHSDTSRDRTIAELRTELEQMTSQLDIMLQRHRSAIESENIELAEQASDSGYSSSHNGDGKSVIRLLDSELSRAWATITSLQRQLDANAEKSRLESITERKQEIQLRAMREKKEAAEARCKELSLELEKRSQTKGFDQSLSNLGATMSSFLQEDKNEEEMQKLKDRVKELEYKLQRAKDKAETNDAELEKLRASVRDYEVRCHKAESQIAAVSHREQALETELRESKDELSALQLEKQKWERILKRESVMQVMQGGGDAMRGKFEQQLEEQRQEYEAQLQEQHALLAKTQRAYEAAEAEREKMASICKDLEDLVRDKTRTVDARDVQITRLESDLAEIKRQKAKGAGIAGDPHAAAQLKEAQDAFSKREEAWIAQSASMEANFEGILKEFDRLTVTAMEFETDRRTYEQRIEHLTREVQRLDNALADAKISNLGQNASEGPTTASLRREFRKLVSDMKVDHQRVLDQEIQAKKKLESRLNDLRHERDVAQYGRVNKGVQTLFIAEP